MNIIEIVVQTWVDNPDGTEVKDLAPGSDGPAPRWRHPAASAVQALGDNAGMTPDLDPSTVVVHAGRPARVPDAPVGESPVFSSTYVAGGDRGLRPLRQRRLDGARGDARRAGRRSRSELRLGHGGRCGGLRPRAGRRSGGRAAARLQRSTGAAGPAGSDRTTDCRARGYCRHCSRVSRSGRRRHAVDRVADQPGDGGRRPACTRSRGPYCGRHGRRRQHVRHAAAAAAAVHGRRHRGALGDQVHRRPLGRRTRRCHHRLDDELWSALELRRRSLGAIPGPMEACPGRARVCAPSHCGWSEPSPTPPSWPARLLEHPRVSRVRYPGLPDDPGHARAAAQMSGFGAILAIELGGDAEPAPSGSARAPSSGSTPPASAASSPCSNAAAAGPIEVPTIPEDLIRLSVGIEHPDDLWADLAQALKAYARSAPTRRRP